MIKTLRKLNRAHLSQYTVTCIVSAFTSDIITYAQF